ncbi:MAG TPA: DUF6600 domain-containing protein [Planctomycetota bacterium]|nr:DUF6600 domain-containing protein [Planctomycetota bacterium]
MKVHEKVGFVFCWLMFTALPAFASQNVDEVIKMTKGGASADVLVAYIEKSSNDPRLSADDLVSMDNAGVPAAVIEAMLAKEKTVAAASFAGTPSAEAVTVAPAADNADISYFYDSMSHDGAWTNDAEYGWSWSPTVCVGDPNWRPYVDNGSWLYTDDGWYWNSGYDWGWAAFHYGRWSHRENNWYWHPDNVWGASWVSWRNSNDYYGWAPLTPRARFGAGGGFDVGITTGNFDLNIGLGERDYAFVRSNEFFDRDLNRRQIRGTEATNIYKNTTITNTYTNSNNRYVNQGIPVKNVALATKQEIKAVTLVDHPAKAGEAVHVGALQNNRLEVFRPTLAAKTSVDPIAAAARRTESSNKHIATPNKPAVSGGAVKVDAAEAARKADAVKRVTERAAKEPQLKPKVVESVHREVVDKKVVNTPDRVPEVKTPAEHAPARTLENRENLKTPDDAPKTHEPVKSEPARTEPPARAEPPTRAEPPARAEPPSRAEPPARSEKSEKSEKNEK